MAYQTKKLYIFIKIVGKKKENNTRLCFVPFTSLTVTHATCNGKRLNKTELQRDINELHCLTRGMNKKSYINDILGSNDGALGSAYTFR